ncbi:MAG: replication-associated recombination protein A [Microgenomates group bacterium]
MPLAAQLRPQNFKDFIGQSHLVGNDKPLTLSIKNGHVFSMILWGPPGVGKTTLARLICKEHHRTFHELSAVSASKQDVRDIIEKTKQQKQLLESYEPPIVFLDEIHRFNKAQQDYLLPHVESGAIVLIGATTENPSFEVIPALLSRTKVYVLEPLADKDISKIILRALSTLDHDEISQDTSDWLIAYAGGDARKLLNLLEHTYSLYAQITIDFLKKSAQNNQLSYDKKGDAHYDTISAFIKSMRASNMDASLYYLARMIESGEDPKFIARRMVIFASEDIGLANPTALVVANEVFSSVERIGYPEAQINLAHGVAHLARCKKDRSAYDAYFRALEDVKKFGALPVPMNLRNAPTKLMKKEGYGKNYQMYPAPDVSLLPSKIKQKKYFEQPATDPKT